MPLEKLYQLPNERSRRLTTLAPNEIIVEISAPIKPHVSRGTYLKVMDRRVWQFAEVSVAVQLSFDGDRVRDARVVFGGVAPVPWRVPAAEKTIRNRNLDDSTIAEAAELSVDEAKPLTHNGYKVQLVKAIVRRSLETLRR